MARYVVVFAVVFGVNLLPAFGPPTWAVLVLYRLNGHLNSVALVAIGALAAALGRFALANAFRRLQGRFSDRRKQSLDAVRQRLDGSRSKTFAGLALFALSPLPSAQLFEAAGLMKLALKPLVAAFFAGRLVSYAVYVGGATAVSKSSVGSLLTGSLTDWRAVAIEVVLVAGTVALTRIDWARRLGASQPSAPAKT